MVILISYPLLFKSNSAPIRFRPKKPWQPVQSYLIFPVYSDVLTHKFFKHLQPAFFGANLYNFTKVMFRSDLLVLEYSLHGIHDAPPIIPVISEITRTLPLPHELHHHARKTCFAVLVRLESISPEPTPTTAAHGYPAHTIPSAAVPHTRKQREFHYRAMHSSASCSLEGWPTADSPGTRMLGPIALEEAGLVSDSVRTRHRPVTRISASAEEAVLTGETWHSLAVPGAECVMAWTTRQHHDSNTWMGRTLPGGHLCRRQGAVLLAVCVGCGV